jgi:hypothetical protein
MQRGKYITGHWAVAVLAIATMLPSVCVAQKNAPHPAPPPRPAPMPQQHMSRPPATPPPRQQVHSGPQQQGHVGDWLRRYKDLPPDEQERALQSDPAFQRLTPERQQQLRQRLVHFSSLPPQQQLRMLNRMDTWEHLTPEQKQQARQIFKQMQQLPPDRQRMVQTAVRDLRAMPPDQREKIIDSDRFKGMFSDQEREMMRGVTRLPLAPAESEGAPPE